MEAIQISMGIFINNEWTGIVQVDAGICQV